MYWVIGKYEIRVHVTNSYIVYFCVSVVFRINSSHSYFKKLSEYLFAEIKYLSAQS